MSFSTHVLDTSRGLPVAGVPVRLETPSGAHDGVTDTDGRWRLDAPLEAGRHRLVLRTEFASGFFPEVTIVFTVADERHHHVPLLLSPYGYSTYRGS
ncbi:hydroxyisourate hydrolase [Dactylosporangium sp. NPDC000521]|uniref:hydroxyisourate hydrolase n=1 Tax=Dactylosporangium sp. NPDC000521 TaxID=3363975 RepID=UPI0036A81251